MRGNRKMPASETEPEKDHHHHHHPQFFRDDTAEQRAIDSIGTGHWLRDFLARLVRVLQSIAKKKR